MPISQQTLAEQLQKSVGGVASSLEKSRDFSEKITNQWFNLAELVKHTQHGIIGWVLGMSGLGNAVKGVSSSILQSFQRGHVDVGALERKVDDLSLVLEGFVDQLQGSQTELDFLNRQLNTIAREREGINKKDLENVEAQLSHIRHIRSIFSAAKLRILPVDKADLDEAVEFLRELESSGEISVDVDSSQLEKISRTLRSISESGNLGAGESKRLADLSAKLDEVRTVRAQLRRELEPLGLDISADSLVRLSEAVKVASNVSFTLDRSSLEKARAQIQGFVDAAPVGVDVSSLKTSIRELDVLLAMPREIGIELAQEAEDRLSGVLRSISTAEISATLTLDKAPLERARQELEASGIKTRFEVDHTTLNHVRKSLQEFSSRAVALGADTSAVDAAIVKVDQLLSLPRELNVRQAADFEKQLNSIIASIPSVAILATVDTESLDDAAKLITDIASKAGETKISLNRRELKTARAELQKFLGSVPVGVDDSPVRSAILELNELISMPRRITADVAPTAIQKIRNALAKAAEAKIRIGSTVGLESAISRIEQAKSEVEDFQIAVDVDSLRSSLTKLKSLARALPVTVDRSTLDSAIDEMEYLIEQTPAEVPLRFVGDIQERLRSAVGSLSAVSIPAEVEVDSTEVERAITELQSLRASLFLTPKVSVSRLQETLESLRGFVRSVPVGFDISGLTGVMDDVDAVLGSGHELTVVMARGVQSRLSAELQKLSATIPADVGVDLNEVERALSQLDAVVSLEPAVNTASLRSALANLRNFVRSVPVGFDISGLTSAMADVDEVLRSGHEITVDVARDLSAKISRVVEEATKVPATLTCDTSALAAAQREVDGLRRSVEDRPPVINLSVNSVQVGSTLESLRSLSCSIPVSAETQGFRSAVQDAIREVDALLKLPREVPFEVLEDSISKVREALDRVFEPRDLVVDTSRCESVLESLRNAVMSAPLPVGADISGVSQAIADVDVILNSGREITVEVSQDLAQKLRKVIDAVAKVQVPLNVDVSGLAAAASAIQGLGASFGDARASADKLFSGLPSGPISVKIEIDQAGRRQLQDEISRIRDGAVDHVKILQRYVEEAERATGTSIRLRPNISREDVVETLAALSKTGVLEVDAQLAVCATLDRGSLVKTHDKLKSHLEEVQRRSPLVIDIIGDLSTLDLTARTGIEKLQEQLNKVSSFRFAPGDESARQFAALEEELDRMLQTASGEPAVVAQLVELSRQLLELKRQEQDLMEGAVGNAEKLRDLDRQRAAVQRQMVDVRTSRRSTEAELESVRQTIEQGHKSNKVLEALNMVNLKRAAAVNAAAFIGLYSAILYYRRLNDALIQANVISAERRRLMSDILQIQMMTGNETDGMLNAARALVGYGIDLRRNFKDALSTVVMLEEGLGVTEEHGAQLVFYFEQRLQRSARELGGLIGSIADRTALSADKAAEYAINIGKALTALKVGVVAPKAVDDLSRFTLSLEAASQNVTGMSGDFSTLLSNMMTTVEGFQQAQFLGIRRLDELQSPQGLTRMVEGLKGWAAQLDSLGSNERIVKASQLSQQLGVTSSTLLNLGRILPEFDRIISAEGQRIDLERRWREQISQSGMVWVRLRNSMLSLVHYGLWPVIWSTGKLAEGLNVAIGWMTKFKVTSYIAAGAMTALAFVAGYIAAREIRSLTLSIVALATAATIAARKVNEQAGAQTATSLIDLIRGRSKGETVKKATTSGWGWLRDVFTKKTADTGAKQLELFKTAAETAREAKTSGQQLRAIWAAVSSRAGWSGIIASIATSGKAIWAAVSSREGWSGIFTSIARFFTKIGTAVGPWFARMWGWLGGTLGIIFRPVVAAARFLVMGVGAIITAVGAFAATLIAISAAASALFAYIKILNRKTELASRAPLSQSQIDRMDQIITERAAYRARRGQWEQAANPTLQFLVPGGQRFQQQLNDRIQRQIQEAGFGTKDESDIDPEEFISRVLEPLRDRMISEVERNIREFETGGDVNVRRDVVLGKITPVEAREKYDERYDKVLGELREGNEKLRAFFIQEYERRRREAKDKDSRDRQDAALLLNERNMNLRYFHP